MKSILQARLSWSKFYIVFDLNRFNPVRRLYTIEPVLKISVLQLIPPPFLSNNSGAMYPGVPLIRGLSDSSLVLLADF